MSLIKKILFLLSVLMFSGCSHNNLNVYKHADFPSAWIAPLPSTKPHGGQLTELNQWWQQFNDPVLLALIDAAQKVSPDIASAHARVIAERAAVTVVDAQLLPNVTADASLSRGRDSSLLYPTAYNANVGVSSTWELDVWGKNKADKNEEQAKLIGTNAMWHEARVIVAAETAKQYINYRLCEKLMLVANENVISTAETARLSGLTAKAGLSDFGTLSQFEAQAAEANNQLGKQQLQCLVLIKGLVALTGVSETALTEMLDKSNQTMPVPEGIEVSIVPATILAQRPDVLNAERNVAAASFEIASTEGQRYPRLSLAGNIGLSYNSAAKRLVSTKRVSALDGLTWSIGPIAVSLPLFDAGVREANITAAKAQYEAAKVTYESVVRNAVREVEESLLTLNSTSLRMKDVSKSADSLKLAFETTQKRYESNLANQFELEESRRARLQAEMNLLGLENERVLAWITLYRAMGGGWTPAENAVPDGSVSLILDTELKHDVVIHSDPTSKN